MILLSIKTKHFHTKNFPVSLAHFDTNVITQKLCFPVQLKETYNVHRMTGLAFVLLDDNCVRFCLDTFYQGILTRHLLCIKLQDINLFKFLRGLFFLFCTGQYFEPFYIEIHIQDEKIRVRIFQELTIKPNVF
jgi:hypothetical protein